MTTSTLQAHRTYFTIIRQRALGAGFFDDSCKEFYLRRLLQCQGAFHVRLHAYLLMETQLFLMVTPLTPSGLGAFTRFLGACYDSYYSIRFERRQQVWQSTASVCLLPNDKLIRDCQKFIERFVLRSENHPGAYHYSSYNANAFSLTPRYLKRHRAVSELLDEEPDTLARYRTFIASEFPVEYERFLQSRLLHGRGLLGKRMDLRLEKDRILTDTKKSGTIEQIRQVRGKDSKSR